MGKFTNTNYVSTLDKLVDASKSKLNNPYYKFSDKKPTVVTYYSQNVEKSTLDQASGLNGEHVGDDSPFKFNKIKDFVLYGISNITTEYDVGDWGTESAPISGDAYILPNTIIPRPGDFFVIKYIKESILFKVNSSTPDTLDNGSNIYKIEYMAELTNAIDDIERQVVKEFSFIVSNVGTDFKTVVQSSDLSVIQELEVLVEELITYFSNIFFNSRLQTFVFNHDGWLMYDPFMIEFLIRNKVLNYGDSYIYVSHAMATNRTFSMDYYKTFFKCIEDKKIDINCASLATADMIQDPNSLFMARKEPYYAIRYADNSPYKTRFSVFNMDVLEHISSNTMYDEDDPNVVYNLWIAYFNNSMSNLKGNIVEIVKRIDYMDNLPHFYALGITIFILEQYITSLLS